MIKIVIRWIHQSFVPSPVCPRFLLPRGGHSTALSCLPPSFVIIVRPVIGTALDGAVAVVHRKMRSRATQWEEGRSMRVEAILSLHRLVLPSKSKRPYPATAVTESTVAAHAWPWVRVKALPDKC